MSRFLWNTPEALRSLLCELVSWESRTLTNGEREFAYKLEEKLLELDYFKKNRDHLSLHEVDLDRKAVTALYKHEEAAETIVLLSHFDTVHTEEYGDLEPLAFYPEQLTEKLHERKDELHEEARIDLESGKYLFGRGTMDMKMGLALHMALIEKASVKRWPINLLLVTVPDEEVNSAGMRAAVRELVHLRKKYDLSYKIILNSEPSFSQSPGDETHYIYSGTLGKIMPAALFYGKESHVGEPLKGMTANYIASFLTQMMEWNADFTESDYGERTPLPVSLQQKDLKMDYSTKTPYHAAALYNVFLMKKTPSEIMDSFEEVAKEAANLCNISYKRVCDREQVEGVGEVKVYRFEELNHYAEKKLGKVFVAQLKNEVLENSSWDEREKSFRIADQLMVQCRELAPAIILLFAPPYYPAVNSSNDSLIRHSVQLMKETAEQFNVKISQVHYFNGICDLSYVNYNGDNRGWIAYERNTPVWGNTYRIPFSEMTQIQAPVLNVGPFGKDAHQRTERLHVDSAFVQLPVMFESLIRNMMQGDLTKEKSGSH